MQHCTFRFFYRPVNIRWLATVFLVLIHCFDPTGKGAAPSNLDLSSTSTTSMLTGEDNTSSTLDPPTTTFQTTDKASEESSDPTSDLASEDSEDTQSNTDTGPDQDSQFLERTARVYLDGILSPGIIIKQGGVNQSFVSGKDGSIRISIDASPSIGQLVVHASHPQARIAFAIVDPKVDEDIVLKLQRFDPRDNEEYQFYPPGTPEDLLFCAHCHPTINNDWYESPHRNSAKNTVVQDLYAGVAAALDQEKYCIAKGGNWWPGLEPGTGLPQFRCYIGAGALPDLNRHCGASEPCDDQALSFGGCADCHAPGINGKLGNRDLLEARGDEFEFGVHCDVCHKVESLDLNAAPGVGGRLKIHRPMEPSVVPGDTWKPLSFGPFPDVSNFKMGAVVRDHFGKSEFCAGCHQHDVSVDPAWGSIDLHRWPTGTLPIQSTYEEWRSSPLSPVAPCVSCHMPPDSSVNNAADIQQMTNNEPGIIAGWPRPAGSIRQHSWKGPRQAWSGMLENAAAVFIEKSIVGTETHSELVARVTVRNVGCGHALPTGEPMRSIILLVQASCDETILDATGGATIPDFGGWLDRRFAQQDWKTWPGARVGEVVRVTRYTGQWYDYKGFASFGNGRFEPKDKGMPIEEFVQSSTITAMADGTPTFEPPLAAGDVAYRGEATGPLSAYDKRARALAGSPGFAFARVLSSTDGSRQVPHFRARDVVSDNRLLPQQEWTSEHRFRSTCENPQVRALLVYRPYPLKMARERDWSDKNPVMVSTWK